MEEFHVEPTSSMLKAMHNLSVTPKINCDEKEESFSPTPLKFITCSTCPLILCAMWWCLGIMWTWEMRWSPSLRRDSMPNNFGMPPLLWAFKWKSPLHLGLLILLYFHAFSSLHRPYDGFWKIIGAEVEESFRLKALPHPKLLYKEFYLYGK